MFGFALLAVGAYALGFAWLYSLQERLVYFPSRTLASTPAAAGLAYEEVTFHADDGVALHGWFVPHPQARHTVLFLHGNAGNISH
ncbi:MAG TPA: alpha/beta hydrolase, partial [Alphaproteobacteria bacterium]|nr:alpha/beta hydrolase [Alphaproteobacteria bacterium]